MITSYLKQLYPRTDSGWATPISFCLFISLFLYIFQPFGLYYIESHLKPIVIPGYGVVAFIVMTLNYYTFPYIFKKWFSEDNWTILKQFIWTAWMFFTIGIGIYLYNNIVFNLPFNLNVLLYFQLFSFAVGIMPVVFLTIINHNRLLSKNLKSANELNIKLKPAGKQPEKEQTVCLIADNDKDKLETELSDLLYIESVGNYLEVFYLKNEKFNSTLLRNTLKNAETQLAEYNSLVRCHRAFIVNIDQITKVKGNSQGLKLFLNNSDLEIPVSRGLAKSLKDKIGSVN